MEMGCSQERIAFIVCLAWQDVQVCRIPKCQPSSNYDLVLQDSGFNITNMHRAHVAVDPFQTASHDVWWTTVWKLHSFVNSTVSPGQFNYSEKINKERKEYNC